MESVLPVGCVIMASGLSRRFGSNKLLADFAGQPMLCRAFDAAAVPPLAARIVVTRSDEVRALCAERGIPVLLHALPERNDTVRLGLRALLAQQPDLAGCMFLPGDQPLLRRKTVEDMIHVFSRDCRARQKETEREIYRLGAQVQNDQTPLAGSPVLFGKGYFAELCALPEGKGGNVLLKKYPSHVHTVCIAAREELLDADTPQMLEQLERLLQGN